MGGLFADRGGNGPWFRLLEFWRRLGLGDGQGNISYQFSHSLHSFGVDFVCRIARAMVIVVSSREEMQHWNLLPVKR